jgi:preprotein translocase subunit YajC
MELLAASSGSGSSSLSLLLPLILIGAFFYLFMIRPQKRKVRQHDDLVASLVPGDEVVTIGGISGYVTSIDDEFVKVEIADGVVIRVLRQAIGRKVEVPALHEETEGTDEGDHGAPGLEGKTGTDDTE